MGDYALYSGEIGIGGGTTVSQHIFGVENIQAFVFHRAHIEVAHRHNHVNIQIVFEAETGFVPLHRVFQRLHRKADLIGICRAGVKLNRHFPPARGGKTIAGKRQIARHQGKQIARFVIRIQPFRPMAAVDQLAAVHLVTIRKQHRKALFVGNNGGGELGHHIRAVGIKSDFAETLRLALGIQIAAAFIQTHQRFILARLQTGFHFQHKLFCRYFFDNQLLAVDAVIRAHFAVDF